MPAKDRYHDTVVRALQKAGWTIVSEQVTLTIDERRLWIDLRARRNEENRVILIEVKGFENLRSPVDYFANAIGKYVLYSAMLDYANIKEPLYMAVPKIAYNEILSEEISQHTLKWIEAKLIVFDPEQEELVSWENYSLS